MLQRNALIVLSLLLLPVFAVFLQGTKAGAEVGKKEYNQYCMACHMADGKGMKGLNPPLVNVSWVNGDKSRLIEIVLKGMNEPITVDGVQYTTPMPATAQLSNQQVADVLTYIRSSWGNNSSAVTAAEVQAVR